MMKMSQDKTQKIIAVDLDGTIAEYDGWKGVGNIGVPISKVERVLRELKRRGWYILVFTCRLNGKNTKLGRVDIIEENKQHIENWFKAYGVPYDEITLNVEGKPFAHVYLDDRAINPLDFANSEQILELCEKFGGEAE